MAATTTPPPVALRARTPPTPLHGPQYDSYEPYSPRRSKRSTAHSNPYSSFNSERSPQNHSAALRATATTPPPTQKRARFARTAKQLSSPPSSPEVPVKHTTSRTRQTPKKALFKYGLSSDSEGTASHSLTAPHPTSLLDPTTMLPTPSKTPRKRQSQQTNSITTGRILNFQPQHPNDVMPTPRKLKAQHRKQASANQGFELFDEDLGVNSSGQIEVYTDTNNRVPEMDVSDDNPFVGPRRKRAQRVTASSRKTAAQREQEAEIDDAAQRDEGVVYVFRGRKIFKRFASPPRTNGHDNEASNTDEAPTDLEDGHDSLDQRNIKRKAGAAAQRPLTRSSLKPKLLFASKDDEETTDVDELATDIEMPNAPSPSNMELTLATPKKPRAKNVIELASPPPTKQTQRQTGGKGEGKKNHSPFDEWPRTKSASRKRAGEAMEAEGSTAGTSHAKRTRSAVASPA